MSICVLSQFDKYDLRKGSFRAAWEEFLLKVRRKKITRPSKCVACSIKAMCGMCPANGELENGDPESPVDFLCATAHLRAHAFGVDVTPHGECEYCEGGEGHEDLMTSLASLRSTVSSVSTDVEGEANEGALSTFATAQSSGCRSGGCSSCSLAAVAR